MTLLVLKNNYVPIKSNTATQTQSFTLISVGHLQIHPELSNFSVAAVHVMLPITCFIHTKCNTVNYRLDVTHWILLRELRCTALPAFIAVSNLVFTCYLLNTFNKTISTVYKSDFLFRTNYPSTILARDE